MGNPAAGRQFTNTEVYLTKREERYVYRIVENGDPTRPVRLERNQHINLCVIFDAPFAHLTRAQRNALAWCRIAEADVAAASQAAAAADVAALMDAEA